MWVCVNFNQPRAKLIKGFFFVSIYAARVAFSNRFSSGDVNTNMFSKNVHNAINLKYGKGQMLKSLDRL